jgi:hypothetical protein
MPARRRPHGMDLGRRLALRQRLVEISEDTCSGSVEHDGFVLVPLHLWPSPSWRRGTPLVFKVGAYDIDTPLHAIGASYFGPAGQYMLNSIRDGYTFRDGIRAGFDLFYFEADDDDPPYMPLDFGCFRGRPGRELVLEIAASERLVDSPDDPQPFVLVLVCRRVDVKRAAVLEQRASMN